MLTHIVPIASLAERESQGPEPGALHAAVNLLCKAASLQRAATPFSDTISHNGRPSLSRMSSMSSRSVFEVTIKLGVSKGR